MFWTPLLLLSASFLDTYFPQNTIYLSYFVSLFSHIFFLYKPLYVTHNIPLFFLLSYLNWIPIFLHQLVILSHFRHYHLQIFFDFLYPHFYFPLVFLFPLILIPSYFRSSASSPLPDMISFHQLSLSIPAFQHSFFIHALLFRRRFPCVLFILIPFIWLFPGRAGPLSTHSRVEHFSISGLPIARY